MVLSQTEFVELQNGKVIIESCTIISKYIVLKFIFLLDSLEDLLQQLDKFIEKDPSVQDKIAK